MKKFLVISMVMVLILLSGCTRVEGKYKEGTYFAYDQTTSYTVVMYVNENGEIKSLFFDSIFLTGCTTRGVISTCQGATTKQRLGDDYNMRRVSSIDKEWHEQVNAFASKVVEEQGLDWLALKYKDDDGNIIEAKPENKTEEDKIYTDSVAGVTIVVDNLSRLVNDVLGQARK